jgi:hypothetical protein
MPVPTGMTARLAPQLSVSGEMLTLLVQESAPVDSRSLRKPLASLRSESHHIVDALDAVISGV